MWRRVVDSLVVATYWLSSKVYEVGNGLLIKALQYERSCFIRLNQKPFVRTLTQVLKDELKCDLPRANFRIHEQCFERHPSKNLELDVEQLGKTTPFLKCIAYNILQSVMYIVEIRQRQI